MPFSKLDLSAKALDGVRAAGYADPTPIQLRAIPIVMAGAILIGSRPDRHRQNRRLSRCRSSLASASTAHCARSCSNRRASLRRRWRPPSAITAASPTCARRFVFGGTGYGKQDKALRQGTDILVATPGRLLDQMQRGMVRLESDRDSRPGRGGPNARHGFSARRAPHRRALSAHAPDDAVLRHDSARDRAALQVGAAQCRDHRDRPAPFARRDRNPCSVSRGERAEAGAPGGAAPAHRLRSGVDLLPHQDMAPTVLPASCISKTMPSPCCTPTALSASANRRSTVFAMAVTK